jgi:glutamine cyclotransferase
VNRFLLSSLLALSGQISGCAPQSGAAAPSSPAPKAAPASLQTPPQTAPQEPATAPKNGPRQLSWRIAGQFPHDISAFTEGLFWKDDLLFESTGLEGQSDVRRVDPATGQVLQRWKLPAQFFGEGLSFLNGKFYYLTWQTKIGFVLDANFKPVARFSYGNEGWGLTTDGEKLLQSDGTDILTWRSPKDFKSLGQIKVTRNGAPLRNLNELEWIRGYVWANVWQTDEIVVIDPKTGKVVAQLDLLGLLPTSQRTGQEDVLNGIAYDAKTDRIFVTGKNWPKLFWIQVEDKPGGAGAKPAS